MVLIPPTVSEADGSPLAPSAFWGRSHSRYLCPLWQQGWGLTIEQRQSLFSQPPPSPQRTTAPGPAAPTAPPRWPRPSAGPPSLDPAPPGCSSTLPPCARQWAAHTHRRSQRELAGSRLTQKTWLRRPAPPLRCSTDESGSCRRTVGSQRPQRAPSDSRAPPGAGGEGPRLQGPLLRCMLGIVVQGLWGPPSMSGAEGGGRLQLPGSRGAAAPPFRRRLWLAVRAGVPGASVFHRASVWGAAREAAGSFPPPAGCGPSLGPRHGSLRGPAAHEQAAGSGRGLQVPARRGGPKRARAEGWVGMRRPLGDSGASEPPGIGAGRGSGAVPPAAGGALGLAARGAGRAPESWASRSCCRWEARSATGRAVALEEDLCTTALSFCPSPRPGAGAWRSTAVTGAARAAALVGWETAAAWGGFQALGSKLRNCIFISLSVISFILEVQHVEAN